MSEQTLIIQSLPYNEFIWDQRVPDDPSLRMKVIESLRKEPYIPVNCWSFRVNAELWQVSISWLGVNKSQVTLCRSSDFFDGVLFRVKKLAVNSKLGPRGGGTSDPE